jgi:hypothetical protein
MRVCPALSIPCSRRELTRRRTLHTPRNILKAHRAVTSTPHRAHHPTRSRTSSRPRRRRSHHRVRQRATARAQARSPFPASRALTGRITSQKGHTNTIRSINRPTTTQVPRRPLHLQEPAHLHRLQTRRQLTPDYRAQGIRRRFGAKRRAQSPFEKARGRSHGQ